MFSSLLILSLAAVAPLAQATVFITNPIASSSLPAGQSVTITWQDDGSAPTLASFGPASIGLFAGSQQQQTLLQSIAENVDVSKVSSQTWTPDATVGPNFDSYFIRFTSNSFQDPTQPQFMAEAFSAKFTLTGMTGTFNATVQAQISGAATASGAASTAAASGSASAASATRATSTGSTPSTAKASTAASSAATAKSSSSGAGHITVPRVLTATGIAAISFVFFL